MTGAIVVDMGKRMNRILEVNEKYGYALLEPGVTYFDLYEHLEATNSILMLDTPDLGWGSVVGNTLDRGVGYTPYGDHFLWQTGLEVVLPQGEVMRTGMGALPGSNAWQLFPYGFGPYPDGMFTQSNLGIVTKMGIALMQRPPASMTYLITFQEESDLEQIVDVMLPLRINMAPIQNVPVLRNIILDAGVVSQRSEWYDGEGPLPREAIKRMQSELGLGYWNFYGTLYGPPPMIEMFYGMIQEAFGQIPGAQFFTTRGPARGRRSRRARAARPPQDQQRHPVSLDEMKLLDWVPNGGHIGFSPVSAPDGADAMRQFEMVRSRADEASKDYAAQFIVGLREMHHICLLLFDTAKQPDRDEVTCAVQAAGRRSGRGRLRRVPHPQRAHGRRHGHLQLGRRRAAEVPRDRQGRARPQRHPRAGQVRGLACPVPRPGSLRRRGPRSRGPLPSGPGAPSSHVSTRLSKKLLVRKDAEN